MTPTTMQVKRKEVVGRQYQQSPTIPGMADRMVELFGHDYLDRMSALGEQLNPIVFRDPDSYLVAETARVDVGQNQRNIVHRLRRSDMIRDNRTNPRTADQFAEIMDVMPDPVKKLLATYTDRYTGKNKAPGGQVSYAVDAACKLTFLAGALDMALMDFTPHNPTDSPLFGEVHDLAEASRKVLIVAGPTAVGKDAIVDMLLKRKILEEFLPPELDKSLPIGELISLVDWKSLGDEQDQTDFLKVSADLKLCFGLAKNGEHLSELDRDDLFEIARRRLGVHRLTKLTSRDRRPDEVDGVHYHYFDGGDTSYDVSKQPMRDPDGNVLKSGGRPTEEHFLSLRENETSPLAYSYRYSNHYYAYPSRTVFGPTYGKGSDTTLTGLSDLLNDPEVKLLILGSGTTPEVLYMKKLLPNATAMYVLPHQPHRSISIQEDGAQDRFEARALKELKHNILVKGESWPRDMTQWFHNLHADSKARFLEVTPQMTLALMCQSKVPGLHLLPNIYGMDNLSKAAQDLGGILRETGNFPTLFSQ